jgi:hypothetical protein
LRLAGETYFNGVFFDDVAAGGIQLRGEEIRKSWKNVFFGENNAGRPDELFAYDVRGDTFGGVWGLQRVAREQLRELRENNGDKE